MFSDNELPSIEPASKTGVFTLLEIYGHDLRRKPSLVLDQKSQPTWEPGNDIREFFIV
eukprot:CAMPEP_0204614584 /NCGR_PEP_ID=MMETSP0717-20131115/2273_1 /ASSEMBLY_ACC=CAM_ASM_000666 /TAXON_ID=230516 /ORGANISM="Chaetoceros curvisetus" /LENGTH=57 /DNA_ID=CAMNT_0051627291 /DNA_START=1174 /DNA_END=1347 /DNA_ORIENTATION=+